MIYYKIDFTRSGMNKGHSTRYVRFDPKTALFYYVQINNRSGRYKLGMGSCLCGEPYQVEESLKETYELHLRKAFNTLKGC